PATSAWVRTARTGTPATRWRPAWSWRWWPTAPARRAAGASGPPLPRGEAGAPRAPGGPGPRPPPGPGGPAPPAPPRGAARRAIGEGAQGAWEPRAMATTLLVAVATPELVAAGQVGDGAVVARFGEDSFLAVTRPVGQDYVNETMFLTSPGAVERAQLV